MQFKVALVLEAEALGYRVLPCLTSDVILKVHHKVFIAHFEY